MTVTMPGDAPLFSLRLPQVSDRREPGKIVRWLVAVGDRVQVGQAIVDLEFGKATLELDAYVSGRVAALLTAPGTTVEVGTVIASIALDAAADVGWSSAHATRRTVG